MTVNLYDMADTWNNGATIFQGIKLNVTDSASMAGSNLMDLQVNGNSQFRVRKDGDLYLAEGAGSTAQATITCGSTQVFLMYGGSGWGNQPLIMGMSGGLRLSATGGSLEVGSRTKLFADASNQFDQRNTTNAQTFNIYNTWTDASNYERGFIRWTANELRIGCEAAGTGAQRVTRIGGATNGSTTDIVAGTAVPARFAQGGSAFMTNLGIGASATSPDVGFKRLSAGLMQVTAGYAGNGGVLAWKEQTAPATPAADICYVYAKDNGSGKTQLIVKMPDGVETVLATET